ncbi:MAG: hypothetical protein LBE55_01100 [Clostridiales bacterium]|jgi:hypothetical protein|nr:hypothetical protein [Clostridiales bacterium]
MAAFEFGNYPERPGRPHFSAPGQQEVPAVEAAPEADALSAAPRLRTEPILALKIYDSCRNKNCLTPSDLGGPALSMGGEPILAPDEAQSVRIEDLTIGRISILSKQRSDFRKGYWDIDIQYDFDYTLRYVSRGGTEIGTTPATNSFTQRLSLFGSLGAGVAIATDIIAGGITGLGGEPFVLAEARAIGLAAEIKRDHCRRRHNDHPGHPAAEEIEALRHHHRRHAHVFVTIGLFSIVKLFRLVSLLVESRGFVIPDVCDNVMPPNPCDVFEDLGFPMDTFSPPQKREFMSKESLDIPGRPCAERMEAEMLAEE